MTHRPLMPTATAVWLVENTSLTFTQIADFCGLHKLEVEGIANDEVAHGVKGFDPIASGQLLLDNIEKCQKNPDLKLEIIPPAETPETKTRKQPRYTPVSRRRDRPDAIAWLLRNHPELTDGQVNKLIGTTKSTVSAVRDRTHWNTTSIKPIDPVSLGLCSQKALDEAVQKAARIKEAKEKKKIRAQKRAAKEKALKEKTTKEEIITAETQMETDNTLPNENENEAPNINNDIHEGADVQSETNMDDQSEINGQ